jgi:tetratricopeptide (TPR) repeat protein
MSLGLAYDANLRRGQALREAGRYREACPFFGEAIRADPDQPQPYLELALAQSELPGRKKESLMAIDQAVARAPDSAHFLGYKAYILSHFTQYKEALEYANRALQVAPLCRIALLAQCNAYTKLSKWAEADASARRMLERDAEDIAALNLLAQALRFQNQHRESRHIVAQILARVPNDAFGQANAGYEALKADDHRRANKHFLQALRFDPNCEHARGGLLQSLRARCLVYRINLKILTAIGEQSQNFGRVCALACFLSGGLLLAPILLYAALALTLQPLSNFFLLLDPTGRRSLVRKERRWALFTGWSACLLLLVLALTHLIVPLALIGGYLALFALSVYLPQWTDFWRAWHEGRALAAEN